MATAREIKRRIGSVKNIAQVTKALEAVSASRVRRAQTQVLASRPYNLKAWEILINIAESTGASHPLLEKREETRSVDIILITSDRSLCGAYNNNIIRIAERFAETMALQDAAVRWITVGRKGRDYLVRRQKNVVAEFSPLPTSPSIGDANTIGQLVIGDYLSGVSDAVFVAYTDFVNMLTQRPVVLSLLPLQHYEPKNMAQAQMLKTEPPVSSQGRDYIYEPSVDILLDQLVPRLTVLGVYQSLLESLASEHSARMIAMRNASENAIALTADLTLEYNKARQAAITGEMLDIVGGAVALGGGKVVKEADEFIQKIGGELRAEMISS